MNYTFYVHDLFYDIGHSNVSIDMINNLPNAQNTNFHFVVFTADSKKTIFPKIHTNITYHMVPFSKIRIAFLKIAFYQLYSFFYSKFLDKSEIKVSLGVANLNCDVSIIHFIHHQWNVVYFKNIRMNLIKWCYKKFFYAYLNLTEKVLFKIIKPKVITVSKFMEQFICSEFEYNPKNITTIHSGFDLSRFQQNETDNLNTLTGLKKSYPQLKHLDGSRPICLFVGAFERKGLPLLIRKWGDLKKKPQLIVIGKSEGDYQIDSKSSDLYYIAHTKEIDLFYDISDYFLFPTIYEPFGMVLIEAAMKGLSIITTRECVGATEVISSIPKIQIFDNIDSFKLPETYEKLTSISRSELIIERWKLLEKYSWESISKKYELFFSKP